MLSDAAIKELLDSKDALTEFTTTALIHAITAGVLKIQDRKTAPTAIGSLIDVIRKVRADLTGDNHELNIPRMLVSIKFGHDARPEDLSIEGSVEQQRQSPPSVGKASDAQAAKPLPIEDDDDTVDVIEPTGEYEAVDFSIADEPWE